MDWKEEMLEAMKMMKSACHKNNHWFDCKNCPFDLYCDYLAKGADCLRRNKEHIIIPSNFDIPESL